MIHAGREFITYVHEYPGQVANLKPWLGMQLPNGAR